MPALTNPKREKACQLRALGKTMEQAYSGAGYSYKPASATKFFKHPAIVSRVTELQADIYEDQRKAREVATQEAGIDQSWIYKRLRYLTDISLQGYPIKINGVANGKLGKPDGPTAVRCLTLAAQMGGFLVQRHEVGGPGDFARMTDQELDHALIEQGKALGIPEEALLMITGPGKVDEAAE